MMHRNLLGLLICLVVTGSPERGEYPKLAGRYEASRQNPKVFNDAPQLRDLVDRIKVPGSFSALMYRKLSRQEKADLTSKVDWEATYSGCDLDIYLHGFSFESMGGYAQEKRSLPQLEKAMNVKPKLGPPLGAAVVAARLALYSALREAGAPELPDSASPEAASALSKKIVMAWALHGFREDAGHFLSKAEQFCEAGRRDPVTQSTSGLQVARGVIYTVQAQDLLESMHVLTGPEIAKINAFHAAMFTLIRNASNFAASKEFRAPERTCEVYSNHRSVHLLGLLAIARILDDGQRFDAVLYGDDKKILVTIGWAEYFDHAI